MWLPLQVWDFEAVWVQLAALRGVACFFPLSISNVPFASTMIHPHLTLPT